MPAHSAATQNITASASLFDSSHVGTDWLIDTNPGNATGEVVWVRVNSVASATVANVTVKDLGYMPTDTKPLTYGKKGRFRLTEASRQVVFYEQRLWYGGTTHKPQTLWASKTGIYEDFDSRC